MTFRLALAFVITAQMAMIVTAAWDAGYVIGRLEGALTMLEHK